MPNDRFAGRNLWLREMFMSMHGKRHLRYAGAGKATVVAINSLMETNTHYYKKVGGVKYSSSSSMMSDSTIVVCVGRILVPVLIDRKG